VCQDWLNFIYSIQVCLKFDGLKGLVFSVAVSGMVFDILLVAKHCSEIMCL
jgi:hypothetical protein